MHNPGKSFSAPKPRHHNSGTEAEPLSRFIREMICLSAFKTRFSAVLLLLTMLLALTACGREKKEETETAAPAPAGQQIMEVRITGANFYDYFDYKEYPSYATDEDGNITACNLSYGFSLREGYTAANDPDHKDTLKVSFTAEGVSQNGDFDVDFKTLHYSGTPISEERETISETLSFWPQGNRTVSYPYGTISSSYIIMFRSFTVTQVSGSIWLRIGS